MTAAALETAVHRVRFMPATQVAVPASAAPVVQLKTQCSTCHLRELCLPCGLNGVDLTRLDAMTFTRRRIKAGQTLYREGDRFQYIYAVRSGTLKSSLLLSDGREQVSGFTSRVSWWDSTARHKDTTRARRWHWKTPNSARSRLPTCATWRPALPACST